MTVCQPLFSNRFAFSERTLLGKGEATDETGLFDDESL
jgi:hypothetical protein